MRAGRVTAIHYEDVRNLCHGSLLFFGVALTIPESSFKDVKVHAGFEAQKHIAFGANAGDLCMQHHTPGFFPWSPSDIDYK